MTSHIELAADYTDSIISGATPACEYVHLACERFVDDLQRDDIYLSDDANKWCRFLEKLPHVKGAWAHRKELLKLSPYQIFIVVNLYGWKRIETNLRRFREGYVEVPRKNGKTFLLAGLGLGHLMIDGEFGAEVYCGATTEIQAWEVFRPARQIVQRDAKLREFYQVEANAKSLTVFKDASRFQPVIGNPGDGASPSAAIADEYHEHKTSDQSDTFVTGMGAREQPMMLYITTAGVDMGGPCYEKRQDIISILKGTYEDDTAFGIVYTLDGNDAWDTVAAQRKANPNYGISVNADFLAAQLNTAKRNSVAQSSYRTKHLNQWVGAKSAWMNMLAYQAVRKKKLSLDDYAGERCIAAVDLASTDDLASLALLFPWADQPAGFVKHYLPEEVVMNGGNSRYKGWHADGWITATPGPRIDYDYIEEDLLSFAERFDVEAVPYDKFQATQFATRMDQAGLPMIQFGATVMNFSEPMKELDKAIAEKRIAFQMDPVLMWMFGNVVAKLDAKDNIFPRKEKNDNKIDGVVALIMAYGVYVQMKPTVIPALVVL
jgi:phage terminase large subunit-like protein